MLDFKYVSLEDRGLITIGGPDRRVFLQGLISNDIERAGPDRAIWAALLTAQGKYLHDFFIVEIDHVLYLDCEAERLMDLGKRLSGFKLRADIDLGIADSLGVWSGFGGAALENVGIDAEPGAARAVEGGVMYCDPRVPEMGFRAILPKTTNNTFWQELGAGAGQREDYDQVRIPLGLPDGSRDMIVEKSILLENNFDPLHGVDWKKGCYIGQELTARTKYRGLVKKRLFPVELIGDSPETGAPIMYEGREAGEIRSVVGDMGLAMLRLEPLENAKAVNEDLTVGSTVVRPRPAYWDQVQD